MSENEKALLKKAKDGDVEAFESLVERYQKKVYNIALRITGNSEDAAEIAQEALIRVFRSLKNFKEESSFSTWIFRITTNLCLDEIRKRKNKQVVYINDEIKLDDGEVKIQIEDKSPGPEEKAQTNEVRRIVNDAIQSLSEEHRTIIVLRDIEGFSYEEIARIVKCPEGTVKSRINRARQSLKDILKKKKELISEYYVK
ncbi:MAG TPA: sigma-70 family RNA polymerase sigma factor [Clostridia bacterium]|nr:sigma-70 family RNA polymerase sigma factor [Clostridia bacterium]